MKNKIVLDTNFIISCIKYKIDFLSELEELMSGHELVVPEEVLGELKRISIDKKAKLKDREAARLGLQIVANLRKIKLEKKYVDLGLLSYIQDHPDDFVATADKKLKKKLRKVIVIRGKKRLRLE